jgi:hypothetical protein
MKLTEQQLNAILELIVSGCPEPISQVDPNAPSQHQAAFEDPKPLTAIEKEVKVNAMIKTYFEAEVKYEKNRAQDDLDYEVSLIKSTNREKAISDLVDKKNKELRAKTNQILQNSKNPKSSRYQHYKSLAEYNLLQKVETQASKNERKQKEELYKKTISQGPQKAVDTAYNQYINDLNTYVKMVETDFFEELKQIPVDRQGKSTNDGIKKLENYCAHYRFFCVDNGDGTVNDITNVTLCCARIAFLKLRLANNAGINTCYDKDTNNQKISYVEFYGAALCIYSKILFDVPFNDVSFNRIIKWTLELNESTKYNRIFELVNIFMQDQGNIDTVKPICTLNARWNPHTKRFDDDFDRAPEPKMIPNKVVKDFRTLRVQTKLTDTLLLRGIFIGKRYAPMLNLNNYFSGSNSETNSNKTQKLNQMKDAHDNVQDNAQDNDAQDNDIMGIFLKKFKVGEMFESLDNIFNTLLCEPDLDDDVESQSSESNNNSKKSKFKSF